MSEDGPIRLLSKIEKFSKKAGGYINSRGEMVVQLSQWGTGHTNSGPAGKRRQRFYPGRFDGKTGANRK